MPPKTWKPSLEEAAVLCVIRTYRKVASHAPLVMQVLARWVAEDNQTALKQAQRAFKAKGEQPARKPGRPRKARKYTPEQIAPLREALVNFLSRLPPKERMQYLLARPSTKKLAEGTLPQATSQIADAILRGLLGIGARTLKGRLAAGARESGRPLGLADIADAGGIDPNAWAPVAAYLRSLAPSDRPHMLSQLLPPNTLPTT